MQGCGNRITPYWNRNPANTGSVLSTNTPCSSSNNQPRLSIGNTAASTCRTNTISSCSNKNPVLSFQLDDGSHVTADTCGNMKLKGTSGLKTKKVESKDCCESSAHTVGYDNLRDLSPYVVDSKGGSEYTTLCAAVKAVNKDACENKQLPTIFVLPGEYYLTEHLNTDIPMNIIGVSHQGQASPIIKGSACSKGNKNWHSVVFDDPCGEYTTHMENKMCGMPQDLFRNCTFTNNYKITTINAVMLHYDCQWIYPDLARKNVVNIAAGSGYMEFRNCVYHVKRHGGSNSLGFFHCASDGAVNHNLWRNCDFKADIQGCPEPMSLWRVSGCQTNILKNVYVNVEQASASKCFIIGHETPQHNVSLCVSSCFFLGNSGRVSNLALIGNLWSINNAIIPITFRGVKTLNMRKVWYEQAPIEQRFHEMIFVNCQLSAVATEPGYEVLLDKKSTFKLTISNHYASSNHTGPLMKFDEVVPGENKVELRVTHFHMRNHSVITPEWVNSTVTNTDVFYANSTLENYDKGLIGVNVPVDLVTTYPLF